MTLPIDRTALIAAQTNQVPNSLLRSALNIAALTTPYDTIDELNIKVNSNVAQLGAQATLINALQTGDSGPAANAARVSAPYGITYDTLKDRVDATDARAESQWVNVKYPHAPLVAAVGDGVTDDTAAIQAAINYASTFDPKKVLYVPNGQYKISSQVTITCDIDSHGVFNVVSGGKFLFSQEHVKANDLNIQIVDKVNYDVVRIKKSHVTLIRPKIVYSIDDAPEHISVNIEPDAYPEGLFNVKIIDGFFDYAKTCIQLKSTGWITACDLVGNTVKSFMEYGIKFDDSPAQGVAYCNVLNTCIENIGVNSIFKTGIHIESFGNVVDNVKDFNDDALAGQYVTISQTNHDLNAFISNPAMAPTLAVHCMTLMQTKYSNIRAEGSINLGDCRNLVDLDNVKNYQHVGITTYGGYDYNYEYTRTSIAHEIDLSTVGVSVIDTVPVTPPSDVNVVTKEPHCLKINVNVIRSFDVRYYLPQYIIDAINNSHTVTLVAVSNVLTAINDSYINIKNTDFSLVTPVLQTVAMRQDRKLLVKMMTSVTVPQGAYLSFQINGIPGTDYKITSLSLYTDFANPLKDIAPYLELV